MAIVYGRLTDYELEKQGKDPYIRTGGRTYRITELVHRHDGGANYQAKEVTESEPEPAEPTMPEPTPIVTVGGGISRTIEPQKTSMVYKDPPLPEPKPFPKLPPPPLAKWAKDQGLYKGHGPVPKAAKDKYRETYGAEE